MGIARRSDREQQDGDEQVSAETAFAEGETNPLPALVSLLTGVKFTIASVSDYQRRRGRSGHAMVPSEVIFRDRTRPLSCPVPVGG